jgi:tetratricopeptide (TPR) repeat protein
MQGSLSPGVLPGLLRDLYVGRRSGLLHFTRGDERRSVGLRRGHISHAQTNVPEDHMGEVLVRLGRLSPDDGARCAELVERDKKRLGQVLLELGLMTKQQVEEALALHVRELLLKVFAWNEGAYSFEEQPEQPGALEEDVAQHLSTGEMILEAVRRVQDPDVVRYALGAIDRVLALSNDPLLRFQKITLSPVDGFLLSRVDGTLSAREVIALAPVSAEEAEKSLFGLLCTGTLEFLPGPPKARPKRVATGRFRLPKPPAPQPEVVRSAPPPAAAAPAPPTPAPPAPAPPDGEKEKALQARRQEIVQLADSLKAKSHFEVLDVPRTASEAQVKDAYFKLARRFHPDTQHDAALKDLAGQIEAIFIRVGEAYEILRNARTRASYEEKLGPNRAGPAPAAAAPEPPPRPAPPPENPPLTEQAVRMAEKLLAQEKYWDVIQALEPQLAEAKGRLKTRAQIVIAKAYLKNPNWVKRAEEELQKVVHAEPTHVEALVLLGGIYKAGGLKARAVAMFRKAVELKPDHEEAAAALLELGAAEKEAAPEEGGSFLKKLFKKS